MKKYVQIKISCGVIMLSEKDNILEFNQYMKSDKMPYIIYADIESLIKKIDECANNPKNSSTTKFGENKHTLYSQKIFYEQVL